MPKALTVRGSYRGYSGHDCTVRSFVRGLAGAGVALELVDMPHWSAAKLGDDQVEPWFATLERPVGAKTALQFCMPHQVVNLRRRRSINFTMFEATPAPAPWIECAKRLPLTILPTRASFDAWEAGGANGSKLRLCPLGVDTERFRPGLEPLPISDRGGRSVGEYAVRILNVSDIVPRKNLLSLLEVWITATSASDDAILIIKLTHGRGSAVRLLREIQGLEQRLGKTRSEAAAILLLDEAMSDHEMPRLYAAATHYWSMSCGEGWDQPMTEAGAAGLRLIAPDHTAYRTYLDSNSAILIPTASEPVPPIDNPDIRAYFTGATWFRPDAAIAADTIRDTVAGQDPERSARPRLATEFTWDQAVDRLLAILDEFEASTVRPWRRPW